MSVFQNQNTTPDEKEILADQVLNRGVQKTADEILNEKSNLISSSCY